MLVVYHNRGKWSNTDGIIVSRHLANAAIKIAAIDPLVLDIANYSTSEKLTGFIWINGKPIYKKTVSCGAMPNSAGTTTAHGITGMTAVIEYRGIGFNVAGMQFIDFQQGNGTNVFVDATNVNINTTIARSQFTAYVTIWYTK